MAGAAPAPAQSITQPAAPPATAHSARPTPPTRDPHTPGYVAAKELPDGANAPADADGNFIIGPTHTPAPEMSATAGRPPGNDLRLHHESTDSKLYPGIAREPGTFGTPDPNDPAKLIVTTSHPAPYTRKVAVYVPKQYVPGTAAPFIVGADGPDRALFTALDNLIAEHKRPRHDRHLHRQRQRRRPGQRARPRIRHHVRQLRRVRRERKCCRCVETASTTSSSPKTPTAAPPWAAAPAAPAPSSWPGITRSCTTACSPTPAPTSTSSGRTTRRPRTAPGSSTST